MHVDFAGQRIIPARAALGVCAGTPVGARDDEQRRVRGERDVVLRVQLAAAGRFLGEQRAFVLGGCRGSDVVSVPF